MNALFKLTPTFHISSCDIPRGGGKTRNVKRNVGGEKDGIMGPLSWSLPFAMELDSLRAPRQGRKACFRGDAVGGPVLRTAAPAPQGDGDGDTSESMRVAGPVGFVLGSLSGHLDGQGRGVCWFSE